MAPPSIAKHRLQPLIQRLQARALSARPADRLGVFMGGARVGLATRDVARFLADRYPRFRIDANSLVLDDADLDRDTRTDLLAHAAAALRSAGLTFAWRDEALEIRAGCNTPVLATIERAVCRTLGITTLAVHMNALATDGRLFVAQRSATKKIDPGLWTTWSAAWCLLASRPRPLWHARHGRRPACGPATSAPPVAAASWSTAQYRRVG